MKPEYDELDQYAHIDSDYLLTVWEKYTAPIGQFLILFSMLEHELNIAIAEYLHDDWHEKGFLVIEKLTMSSKIDLFHKMYLRLESFKRKKTKGVLSKITMELRELNSFRNNIVHANWQSLKRDGTVWSKIVVDGDHGSVKFKKTEITPKIINKRFKQIDLLIDKIAFYREKAFDF